MGKKFEIPVAVVAIIVLVVTVPRMLTLGYFSALFVKVDNISKRVTNIEIELQENSSEKTTEEVTEVVEEAPQSSEPTEAITEEKLIEEGTESEHSMTMEEVFLLALEGSIFILSAAYGIKLIFLSIQLIFGVCKTDDCDN